ncbi:MAG: hypothetical protein ACI88A_001487 [Paraglaciecola sp.]|jgi:hypothetical protein
MNKYERFFKPTKKQLTPCMLGITALFAVSSHANDVDPKLSDFAILSATAAVTCTDSTIIGDMASQVSVTQTNCHHGGEEVIPVPEQVLTEFRDKRKELEDLYCEDTVTSLAGKTLGPGIYCFDQASTTTNGVLTLDLDLESNSSDITDQWIFKIGVGTGALTGTDFVVNMVNGGDACNVNWWVAEAATITRGDFKGNIYAGAAITITGVGPTSPFHGRALANAAVTLTNSEFQGCVGEPGTPDTEEDTSGGFCPAEAKTDVVYVRYDIKYELESESEELIYETVPVIALLDPITNKWLKYEYFTSYSEWFAVAEFDENKRDATSVYTSIGDTGDTGDNFSEFHIDLSKEVPVVNNCEFYQGKSECVRSVIIESSLGSPKSLYDWLD